MKYQKKRRKKGVKTTSAQNYHRISSDLYDTMVVIHTKEHNTCKEIWQLVSDRYLYEYTSMLEAAGKGKTDNALLLSRHWL